MLFYENRWFHHFCFCRMFCSGSIQSLSLSVVFLKLLLYVSFHYYHISGCIRTQLCDCNKEKVALLIIFQIS